LNHAKLKKTSVILYGQSLGGAVAIDMAFRNQERISGLVLENTFLSLPKLVPSVLPYATPFIPFLTSKWDSETLISQIKTESLPVLFLSGRVDELIPPLHMDELFRLCGSKVDSEKQSRKIMQNFSDGSHSELEYRGSGKFG
jgi:abhydrolase domain-containing protein 13